MDGRRRNIMSNNCQRPDRQRYCSIKAYLDIPSRQNTRNDPRPVDFRSKRYDRKDRMLWNYRPQKEDAHEGWEAVERHAAFEHLQ